MKTYQHIAISIDVYENYTPYLKRALEFAKSHTKSISILHVIPNITQAVPYTNTIQDNFRSEAESRFEDLKKITGSLSSDIKIDFQLLTGSPKHEISDFAEEHKADLVIVGSHAKHGFELLLGSTANGIAQIAPCDVLTIRVSDSGECLNDSHYENILLATDLTEDSKSVADTAKEIADEHQAKLHAITVVPDATLLSVAYVPSLEYEINEKTKVKLSEFGKNNHISEDQLHLNAGHAKQEILEVSKDINAGLIIIGSHTHSTLGAVILGSTANAVLHGAQTDVLIVRLD